MYEIKRTVISPTYPLKTPRTKLSIKNEPITIRGTKYIQLNCEPNASLVCEKKDEWVRNTLFICTSNINIIVHDWRID